MGLCISRPGMASDHGSVEQVPERSRPQPQATPAHNPKGIPPRLDAKRVHLRTLGKSAHPSLDAYAAAATSLVKQKRQPGMEMTRLDMENLPALASAENARHPELKLRCYANPLDFLDSLAQLPEGSSRAIVRLANGGNLGIHHTAIDIQKRPGQPATFIVLEPSTLNEHTYRPQRQLLGAMGRRGADTAHIAIVEVGAQKSPKDCVMYCLNFALKAMKNAAVFDELHRSLAETGTLKPEISFEQHFAFNDGFLKERGEQKTRNDLGKVAYAAGALVLPPDFFKHASSLALGESVAAIAAQRSALGELPATARVNSMRHPHPESLTERIEAYRATRRDADGKFTYSASIEGFRLQEIARAKVRAR